MDFKKKLKLRFYIAVSYTVAGLLLLLTAFLSGSDNYFLSAFGSALVVMGIVRIFRHRNITKDDHSLRQQELTETDERNRMIAERARSWAFSLSIILAGAAVIILSLLGHHEEVLPLSRFVCGMTVLHWICWAIIQKKY